jgi:siroheme synthase-like protein
VTAAPPRPGETLEAGPDALPLAQPPEATGAFGYPVFLELRERTVLVAGGGAEAAGKILGLLGVGAHVVAWAPAHDQTAAFDGDDRVELVGGPFDPALLQEAVIAIVATGDRALDRELAAAARAHRVLVNTMDDIPNCDWSAPAILRRGDLTLAIGTGGIAPALAVRLRDRAAREIGPEYAVLLALFGEVRPRIMATGRSFRDRRRLWYGLVDGPAIERLRDGDDEGARRAVVSAIDAWEAAG